MIVVTSPHLYIPKHDDITVFLAGGISGCRDWQQDVINNLFRMIDKDDSQVVVYNPRQKDFNVNDQSATDDQIQPICLYELGRYTKNVFGYKQVISVEKDYIRERDVVTQVALATRGMVQVNLNATPYEHASNILRCIKEVKRVRMQNMRSCN